MFMPDFCAAAFMTQGHHALPIRSVDHVAANFASISAAKFSFSISMFSIASVIVCDSQHSFHKLRLGLYDTALPHVATAYGVWAYLLG